MPPPPLANGYILNAVAKRPSAPVDVCGFRGALGREDQTWRSVAGQYVKIVAFAAVSISMMVRL
jgi:hypothetical protein